jgi:hypothetical protein
MARHGFIRNWKVLIKFCLYCEDLFLVNRHFLKNVVQHLMKRPKYEIEEDCQKFERYLFCDTYLSDKRGINCLKSN